MYEVLWAQDGHGIKSAGKFDSKADAVEWIEQKIGSYFSHPDCRFDGDAFNTTAEENCAYYYIESNEEDAE